MQPRLATIIVLILAILTLIIFFVIYVTKEKTYINDYSYQTTNEVNTDSTNDLDERTRQLNEYYESIQKVLKVLDEEKEQMSNEVFVAPSPDMLEILDKQKEADISSEEIKPDTIEQQDQSIAPEPTSKMTMEEMFEILDREKQNKEN